MPKLKQAKTRPIDAQTDPFTLTGDPARNVQVIVINADEYGLSIVHDLRTVFPMVKLVVLTDDPAKLAKAIAAGASIALPRSSPSAAIVAVVSRLTHSPAVAPARSPKKKP